MPWRGEVAAPAGQMLLHRDVVEAALGRRGVGEGNGETKRSPSDCNSRNFLCLLPFGKDDHIEISSQ